MAISKAISTLGLSRRAISLTSKDYPKSDTISEFSKDPALSGPNGGRSPKYTPRRPPVDRAGKKMQDRGISKLGRLTN